MSTKGVASEFVGELQQDVDALEGMKKGQFQLLYISSESLLRNPQWRELLLSKVYSVLSVSPHKKNIMYAVKKKSSMKEVVENLVRGLKDLRTEMPRIIVFCKRYDECSRMYCLFKYYLRDLFTEPPGAPNLPKFRLVDMYTKCTKGM